MRTMRCLMRLNETNSTSNKRVLVIGYGSTLRGDDGIGLDAADPAAISGITHVAIRRHVCRDDIAKNRRRRADAIDTRAPEDISAKTDIYRSVTTANRKAGKN